jgi:hypothetical protein
MNFFGQNRTIKADKNFASPEYSALTLSSGGTEMTQSIQAEFGRRVDSIPVVGDANVYWGFGNSEGQLSIGRYVGCDGFFKGVDGSACGIIQTLNVTNKGGDDCVCGAGGITFTGGAIISLGFQIAAGQTVITESIGIKIGGMSAS